MAQNDNNISGALIGWIIAILFILFAYWATAGDPTAVYPNSNTCNSAGC